MDVIINNPPVAQTPAPVYSQMQATPYGYGPMPQGYQHHHGPGFLLPLLLIGGFVLFKRRRVMRRFMAGQGGSIGPVGCGPRDGQELSDMREQMREKFRQGKDRFVNDQALSIARERYAKGEINEGEYETLRRNLSGEGRPESTSYAKPQDSGDLKI